MGIEDREPKYPLFKIGEYPILDFQVINGDNNIMFSLVVKAESSPTLNDSKFFDFIKKTGGYEILKNKGWTDNTGKNLINTNLESECISEGANKYKLNFNFIHKD